MKVACLFYFVMTCSSVHAQTKITNDFIAPVHYWGIAITPAMISRTSITGQKNDYHVQAGPQLGAELSVHYHYRFERNYALIIGSGLNILAHNFDYEIPKEAFSPPTASNISTNGDASREMDIIYFRLPVEIERRFASLQNNSWIIRAGGSVLFSVQQKEEIADVLYYPGGPQQYLLRYQDNNNRGKPWVNFHIAAGYYRPFKKNALLVSLKANYSPASFVSGDYIFNVGNQPEQTGSYGVSGSYIGLSVEYLFLKYSDR